MNFSLVCILERDFIPTPIIYLRIFRARVTDVIGQRLANLTKMPTSDQSFDHFYANVSGRKGEGLLGEQTLQRKRLAMHFGQTGGWC